MEPTVNERDLENLVKGNNEFALDLYQALRGAPGNIFFSPYNVSSSMAMIYAGAGGETEKQMTTTLHFNLTQEKLHSMFNMIATILSSRGKDIYGQEGQGFRLINLNSIWSQKDITFSTDFLNVLSHNYNASVELLDFLNNPEKARISINKWVKEQTKNLIPELLPEGSVNSATIFIVTSVVYFKAAWSYQFSEAETTAGQFHLLNGTIVEVPVMRLSEYLNYTKKDGYRAIELPYLGEGLSMVILVPEIHQFEVREKKLDYQKIY
jgi:serpin B